MLSYLTKISGVVVMLFMFTMNIKGQEIKAYAKQPID